MNAFTVAMMRDAQCDVLPAHEDNVKTLSVVFKALHAPVSAGSETVADCVSREAKQERHTSTYLQDHMKLYIHQPTSRII